MRALVYAASFVSGFAALGLEVLWTRMLAEGTGSLIYDFVGILAAFLVGVAAGGAAYRALSRPDRDTVETLAVLFLGVGLFSVATVPLAAAWSGHNVVRALMLLPATTCMGYAFPLAARLVSRDARHSARGIGSLYAWNTAGAILGTLAASFVLTSTLGTNNSILVLGAADAAVALALGVAAGGGIGGGAWRLALPSAAFTIAPVWLAVAGSPLALTATQRDLASSGLPHQHAEDRVSTVDAVGGPVEGRRLYSSGTSMTYLSLDTKLMAYIPKVVRPAAQDFLDICFGMGTTFRSAALLGMHTDAVDLSPSIPRMMPVFYSDADQFLNGPLSRVITADGRNYARLTSRRYDLISIDPPPPIQTAGAAVLYSQQFYADAHRALKPGGVVMMWLYFGVDMDQLREHLRTFRTEFPHMTVLISPRHGGLYLLGSDAPIGWDDATVARIMSNDQANADLMSAPDSRYLPNQPWAAIVDSMRWLSDGQVDRFAGPGPLITDDRPLTEYFLLHQSFAGGPVVSEDMLRSLGPK
jgi:spermidine synthase